MNADHLADLSASDAAQLIREGSLRAEAYAAALVDRQQALPDLNALISFDPDAVLRQARRVDRMREAGEPLGELAGLPFVVKDQIETALYPTTCGTPSLRDYRSGRNAPAVQRMLDAGAVLFATANMHELASGGTSNNPTFGAVRNPYDPARSPGGSSGGTAAAIAARITPLGLGEDTGGSVRIPAGFCGIAGLRPSTWPSKLYPDDGLVPPADPEDTQTLGPMARTVSDLALLHRVVTGQTVTTTRHPGSLRLGVPDARFWSERPLDDAVAETALAAIDQLKSAGVAMVEVDLEEVIALGPKLANVVSTGSRARFGDWLAKSLSGMSFEEFVGQIASRDVRAIYRQEAPRLPDLDADHRRDARIAANATFSSFLERAGVEALAFPNPLILAPPIAPGGDPATPEVTIAGRLHPLAAVALPTMIFGSRLGAPGLTLPIGLARGLPVGMELMARPGQDAALLAIGCGVERALGRLSGPRLRPSRRRAP